MTHIVGFLLTLCTPERTTSNIDEMTRRRTYYIYITLILLALVQTLAAQTDNARWVNPFVGTAVSDEPTLWGDVGGTYPGAVAPWGMVQMSPETSARPSQAGYYWHDDHLLYVSCVGHNSGYPNGSCGMLRLCLLRGAHQSIARNYKGRAFSHADEEARAGYYRMQLADGDAIETTAAQHSGLLRYTTSSPVTTLALHTAGHLTVKGDRVEAQTYNAVFGFSLPIGSHSMHGDTLFLQFDTREKVLQVQVSMSVNSIERSVANGQTELQGGDFYAVSRATYNRWRDELACVDLHGAPDIVLTIFYTALYHSMLMPANVGDAGHETEYFYPSYWDTFRTLHPLLCLLKPQVQSDIMRTCMQNFLKFGFLHHGPMTGMHCIVTLLDSYVKGATALNINDIYRACRASYDSSATRMPLKQYIENGYVDARTPASVSQTAEYAYDDWAMMRLCQLAGHHDEAQMHAVRMTNYARLWDAQSLLMLPRLDSGFVRGAGELGFQESTAYTASLFAPHNNVHLVNLCGGSDAFVRRLDGDFRSGRITFDNEPVLHYPSLFVWARRPDLAANCMRRIVTSAYSQKPGGVPGNDDLGAMSSWAAFAIMGLMPACPGTDEYIIVPPMAREVVLHLPSGRDFVISGGSAPTDTIASFPQPELNGRSLSRAHITHDEICGGGELHFNSSASLNMASMQLPYSAATDTTAFLVEPVGKFASKVKPNQECSLPVKVTNIGADGVCIATLLCDGKPIAQRRVRVDANSVAYDTISYRLFAQGRHTLSVQGGNWSRRVNVTENAKDAARLQCVQLDCNPIIYKGSREVVAVSLKNVDGRHFHGSENMTIDGTQILTIGVDLAPGDTAKYQFAVPIKSPGMHSLAVAGREMLIKVVSDTLQTTMLDVDYSHGRATDRSGFGNDGTPHGPLAWTDSTVTTGREAFIEFPQSPSLMHTGDQITMLTWALLRRGDWHSDFFTKGDKYALKIQDQRTLTFFAGGWGRGSADIVWPDELYGQWHLLAGVCRPGELKIYVDGELKYTMPVSGRMEPNDLPWNIGRNAEMPFDRFGNNTFARTRIFALALTDGQVKEIYETEKTQYGE